MPVELYDYPPSFSGFLHTDGYKEPLFTHLSLNNLMQAYCDGGKEVSCFYNIFECKIIVFYG